MPIYVRITDCSERTEVSIGRDFDPLRLNKKAGCASGSRKDARALNACLETLKIKVSEAYRALTAGVDEITNQKLKNWILSKEDERSQMLLEVFTQHNKEMATLIQTEEYAQRTLTHFETTFKHVQNFRGVEDNLKDMAIEKIDFSFVNDFEFYLIYLGLPR